MKKLLGQLLVLLPKDRRAEFALMQGLIVFAAVLEVVGLLSVAPIMSMATDPAFVETNPILSAVFHQLSFSSPRDFLLACASLVVTILAISFVLSVTITWWLAMFSAKLGAQFGDRLYQKYLDQPWLYHASHASTDMIKKVTIEADRVAMGIVMPLMNANSRLLVGVLTAVTLAIVDPIMALSVVVLFSTSYFLIFKIVRKRVNRNGRAISSANSQRQKLLAEGFGGIKNILLRQSQLFYTDRFAVAGQNLSTAKGQNQGIKAVPRFFLEFMVFATFIGVIVTFTIRDELNLLAALPTLSLFGLATLKLLPAFQSVYGNLSTINGNLPALEEIIDDLTSSSEHGVSGLATYKAPAEASKNRPANTINEINQARQRINAHTAIQLKNLNFEYEDRSRFSISGLTATIPINQTTGIVGASGSGKSTLSDILMGLITPDSGEIIVGTTGIDDNNRQDWRKLFGFVPQDFFLADITIAQNIAFGENVDTIDMERIERVGQQAALDVVVSQLPQGYLSFAGERGMQLSGGQRQRIGIARALYLNTDFLVLDEATSALDAITESQILNVIEGLKGQKTIIIIAHKLETLMSCDQIIVTDKGSISDIGTYQELASRNTHFQNLVG